MSRPRLLDLFCGAGGCTAGYQRAGFYVVGVDIKPQPRYCGDEFIQGDALKILSDLTYRRIEFVEPFVAIHASPPCQAYSIANNIHGRTDHPMLLEPVRELLKATGLPYVIENVEQAKKHMLNPVTVCGRSFDPPLGVKRHRLFESNVMLFGTVCPKGHPGSDWVSIFGHTVLERSAQIDRNTPSGGPRFRRKHLGTDRGREAMGIDWMNRDELSEAIPPTYTEFIGNQLMQYVQPERMAA